MKSKAKVSPMKGKKVSPVKGKKAIKPKPSPCKVKKTLKFTSPPKAARSPSSSRKLQRWGSDDMVDRAITNRLDQDITYLNSLRNAKGESIHKCVKAEMKVRHADGRKLGSRFWDGIIEDFGLNMGLSAGLEDPPEDEEVDVRVLDALAIARNENPAERKSTPFERLLEHTGPLNKKTLYGMFQLIEEGPKLSKSLAFECQVAVLFYFDRTMPVDVSLVRPSLFHSFIFSKTTKQISTMHFYIYKIRSQTHFKINTFFTQIYKNEH